MGNGTNLCHAIAHWKVDMQRTMTLNAVIWDVDGTLVDSTHLGYSATNRILQAAGYPPVSEAQYNYGCRFRTGERFNHHIGESLESLDGFRLGKQYDESYLADINLETCPLYPGMHELVLELAGCGCSQALLSNAVSGYVQAVVELHALNDI